MGVSNDAAPSGWIRRWDRRMMPIEDAANLIAATFIFLLMVLGVVQIVLRTFFNNPLSGYIDLVELSMAGMAFLGAAYTQRMGAHIRMELLLGYLKGRAYWLAEIVGSLLGMGIVAVLVWYSWDHFLRSFQIGDTTIDAEYPVWPSKLLVPIAFAFWFLRLAIQLAGSVRLFIDPSLAPEGVVSLKDAAEVARDEAHEALGDDATGPEGR
ncbi:C4-dicarboxylate ABC transporter substrate-binding protein [Pseudoruegeria sp. SK021]|nr:C4-dicarboxylate ABC transporter substrate-binding protein [Pseudoruegeria sp. SK021]